MRKIAEFQGFHPSTLHVMVAKVYRDGANGWSEWTVRLTVNGKRRESADYFTSDAQDAVSTAKMMVFL